MVTDTSGGYSLGLPPSWTGFVTPSLGSSGFVPGVRAYTNVTEAITNQNYLLVDSIAPQINVATSGTNLWLNWTGISGVTYQVWSSTNLADWYPWGDVIAGTNGAMQLLVPVSDPPQQFFRLKAAN